MKACCIQLITLSCMVAFQNNMARCTVARKDHVASLKVKVTIQAYAMKGYDENVFVSYLYPKFVCKINEVFLTYMVPHLSLIFHTNLPLWNL